MSMVNEGIRAVGLRSELGLSIQISMVNAEMRGRESRGELGFSIQISMVNGYGALGWDGMI